LPSPRVEFRSTRAYRGPIRFKHEPFHIPREPSTESERFMPQDTSGEPAFSDVLAAPFGARVVQDRPGVVTAAVSGELDLASVPDLERAVREVLAARPWRLTIDLTAVTFCGSTGLRALVVLHAAAEEAGAGHRPRARTDRGDAHHGRRPAWWLSVTRSGRIP
jgi:hypothetical protein